MYHLTSRYNKQLNEQPLCHNTIAPGTRTSFQLTSSVAEKANDITQALSFGRLQHEVKLFRERFCHTTTVPARIWHRIGNICRICIPRGVQGSLACQIGGGGHVILKEGEMREIIAVGLNVYLLL